MILQHGKVVKEQWLGEGDRHTPHVLNSVSKTFTATAIGFAVAEGKLKVTDKVISFFPDQLPAEVSPYLKELEIRHLLTMSSGHDVDPTALVRQKGNEKAVGQSSSSRRRWYITGNLFRIQQPQARILLPLSSRR